MQSPILVLIVDDDAVGLEILSQYLDRRGYSIAMASNGKDALSLAAELQPDIILLDVIMPDMDGFETCSHLKENSLTHHIPVIFMTALGEKADRLKGFDVGGVDYVTKPIEYEELMARINVHVNLAQQRVIE